MHCPLLILSSAGFLCFLTFLLILVGGFCSAFRISHIQDPLLFLRELPRASPQHINFQVFYVIMTPPPILLSILFIRIPTSPICRPLPCIIPRPLTPAIFSPCPSPSFQTSSQMSSSYSPPHSRSTSPPSLSHFLESFLFTYSAPCPPRQCCIGPADFSLALPRASSLATYFILLIQKQPSRTCTTSLGRNC